MGKIYYGIKEQINTCMSLLNIPAKDAKKMDDAEIEQAEAMLSVFFTWVKHPDYAQAVPQHKATGVLAIPAPMCTGSEQEEEPENTIISYQDAKGIAEDAMENAGWHVTEHSGYFCIASGENKSRCIAIHKQRDEYDGAECFAIYVSDDIPDNSQEVSTYEYTRELSVEELAEKIMNLAREFFDVDEKVVIEGAETKKHAVPDLLREYNDARAKLCALRSAKEHVDDVLEKAMRSEPSLREAVIDPLAIEVAERMHGNAVVYGPHGMRAEYSVFILNPGAPAITDESFRDEDIIGWITMTPMLADGETEIFYDTGKKMYECSETSIAGLNGLNKETALLPESIEEIAEICCRLAKDVDKS